MKKNVNKCTPFLILLLLLGACSSTGYVTPPPAAPVEQVTHTYQSSTTVQRYSPGQVGVIQTEPGPTLHQIRLAILNSTDQKLEVYLPKTWADSGWGGGVVFLPTPPPDPQMRIRPGKYGFFVAAVVAKPDEIMALCFRESYGFGGGTCRMKKLHVSDVSPAPPLWARVIVAGGNGGFNGQGWTIEHDFAKVEVPRERVGVIRRHDVASPKSSPPSQTTPEASGGFVP